MSSADKAKRFYPIIRVFVSSTFSDLKLERDALQKDVFPELERFCLQHGFQFQAIDLRWGVSSEAGLDHRAMRICFEELRRSQEVSPEPNFLILLGDRYGWQPLPEEISRADYVLLRKAARQVGRDAVRVLKDWYRHDKNVLTEPGDVDTPVYFLQSRLRDARYGRDAQGKDLPDWLSIQDVLWQIINRAFPDAEEQLAERFDALQSDPESTSANTSSPGIKVPRIVRFLSSATEQEIWHGAITVSDARKHILAYSRAISVSSIESFEGKAGLKDFVNADTEGHIDPVGWNALADLRRQLESRLGNNYINAPRLATLQPALDARGQPILDRDGKPTLCVTDAHLADLCTQVATRFKKIIEDQIRAYQKRAADADLGHPQPPQQQTARELEIERETHRRFGDERAPQGVFVGREAELAQMKRYLEDADNRRPLVIHGPSGSGKTALLGYAARIAKLNGTKHIVRFLGITRHSSDLRSLLVNLCRELADASEVLADLPSEMQHLVDAFHDRLGKAAALRPVRLFLDALDQLDEADSARSLWWLRLDSPLPERVKLVVSCLSDVEDDEPTPGEQVVSSLQPTSLSPKDSLEEPFRAISAHSALIPLASLTVDEARKLLDNWLTGPKVRRTLSEDQWKAIEECLPNNACRSPLYLKILFEEARLWRHWDPPALAEDVDGLLNRLFTRLCAPVQHGLLVETALGSIAAARYGLTETEILEVAFADPDYLKQLTDQSATMGHTIRVDPPRIPIALWSRLRYDLAPYLTERGAPGGTVLQFYHRQIAKCIEKRYLRSSSVRDIRHRQLTQYFEKQLLYIEVLSGPDSILPPDSGRTANLRKVTELPWQANRCEAWEVLFALLQDTAFVNLANQYTTTDVRHYWARLVLHAGRSPLDAYADILSSPLRDVGISKAVAHLLHDLGFGAQAVRIRKAVVDRERTLNRLDKLAIALGDLAESLGRCGQHKRGFATLLERQSVLIALKDLAGIAETLGAIGIHYLMTGRYRRADDVLTRAFALAKEADRLTPRLLRCYGHLARLAFMQKDHTRALALLDLQEQSCGIRGDIYGVHEAMTDRAVVYANLGRHDDAKELLSQVRERTEHFGDPMRLQQALGNAAAIAANDGQLPEALTIHEAEERICRSIGNAGLDVCLVNQAKLFFRLRDEKRAFEKLREARRVQKQNMLNAGTVSWWHRTVTSAIFWRIQMSVMTAAGRHGMPKQ